MIYYPQSTSSIHCPKRIFSLSQEKKKTQQSYHICILITDHNVNETLSICDRAYLLIEGKIFKHGTAEELANDEKVKRLYLGTNFELKRKDWIIDMANENSTLNKQSLD